MKYFNLLTNKMRFSGEF